MRQLSRLGVQPRARSARPNILRYSCQGDEIEARQARIVDMVGDGVLALFESAFRKTRWHHLWRCDAAFAALERAYVTRDPDMDDILGQVADFSRGRLEPLSV
jgi:hypothetical protein